MTKNTYTAKVGDRFKYKGQPYEVTAVLPTGSWGRSFDVGPILLALQFIAPGVAPGGRGISVDGSTKDIEWSN